MTTNKVRANFMPETKPQRDLRFPVVAAIAWAVMFYATASILSGCVTNTPGRVLASTAITVDAAMQGWREYVNTGLATQQDREAVAKAYGAYQAAELAAETAYLAAHKTGSTDVWLRSADALRASESALLALIDTLKVKPTAKPSVWNGPTNTLAVSVYNATNCDTEAWLRFLGRE